MRPCSGGSTAAEMVFTGVIRRLRRRQRRRGGAAAKVSGCWRLTAGRWYILSRSAIEPRWDLAHFAHQRFFLTGGMPKLACFPSQSSHMTLQRPQESATTLPR